MTVKPYLSPARKFKIFAHRGTTEFGAIENTLTAFSDALGSGADYIETDVRATSDGVAVLFHDDDLNRIFGLKKKIEQITFAELQKMAQVNGFEIPSLEQALREFPSAKFNLDFKSEAAIAPGVLAINLTQSLERVLVSSFSAKRRELALSLLPGVATSADSSRVLMLLIGKYLRSNWLLVKALRGLDALQIPLRYGPFRMNTPSFVSLVHAYGVEVHFWTVNELEQAKWIAESLQADGIVTDRCKLIKTGLGK